MTEQHKHNTGNWVGRNFWGGLWRDLGGEQEPLRGNIEDHTFENINPSEEQSLGRFPKTPEAEVSAAIESARQAFEPWKNLSRIRRSEFFWELAQVLDSRKEELASVVSLETGKSYNESIAEINEALHMAQYAFSSGKNPTGEVLASEIAAKDSYMIRKPKGVVAIISPFNFPVAIGAFWCAAPALVEGNTVVLKPSEDAPMSSQICAEIYEEVGFPPGVFNLIHGEGETGGYLASGNVDHICFTGSAEVGQIIRRTCADSWHKTCSCEMGSKSGVIVFDDANLDLAIEACVASAFKLSGQRCVSSGRFIVHEDIFGEFVGRFVAQCHGIKTGPPLTSSFSLGLSSDPSEMSADPKSYYGPLINQQALDKVMFYNDMVNDSREVEVVLKGERLDRKGFFLTPTVYTTHWGDEPYLKNEVFGPHVSIIPFKQPEQAVAIYNDTDYGLSVGIITEDFRKARYCRDNCDFGLGYWNGGSIAAESHLGFGGVKKSGNGLPSAARTFRAVTHEVAWTVNHGDITFPQGMLK
jgi:aldehyde dehydrogenase (NAD+)